MTPEAARARILGGIERAKHVEPFRFGGLAYGVRLPTVLQMSIAATAAEKFGAAGWIASLAAQCTEFDGQPVFQANDFSALLGDHAHGFTQAFQEALMPLVQPPIGIPARPAVAPK